MQLDFDGETGDEVSLSFSGVGRHAFWRGPEDDAAFAGIVERLRASGITVMFAGLKKQVTDVMRATGLLDYIGQDNIFTSADQAIDGAYTASGWSLDDVDLFEVNEAFAAVTMAAMHELGIPHDKMNVNGGACALGHPIGASGARIVVTLINALRQRNLKKGVASLCIGGGEATALAIELP